MVVEWRKRRWQWQLCGDGGAAWGQGQKQGTGFCPQPLLLRHLPLRSASRRGIFGAIGAGHGGGDNGRLRSSGCGSRFVVGGEGYRGGRHSWPLPRPAQELLGLQWLRFHRMRGTLRRIWSGCLCASRTCQRLPRGNRGCFPTFFQCQGAAPGSGRGGGTCLFIEYSSRTIFEGPECRGRIGRDHRCRRQQHCRGGLGRRRGAGRAARRGLAAGRRDVRHLPGSVVPRHEHPALPPQFLQCLPRQLALGLELRGAAVPGLPRDGGPGHTEPHPRRAHRRLVEDPPRTAEVRRGRG
mmetsp:Transcript_53099/g.139257  ORF Transcript_53099/g.139257 Transcript_53099/m.139257 type:complete len:295 (-) Transcript_53099:584-1468(-)